MLTYLTINLFHSPAQTLVNTVNTVGVMGKGIALVFKQLYPDMYHQYRHLCKTGKLKIGTLYVYRTPNKMIVNFPTKKHWRNPSRVEYIEAGLEIFVKTYGNYGISSVSFPQLGCGHGELDWEQQVQPVMEHYLKDLPIPVYIHLYPKLSDFVPERLDPEYASQVQLERQILPFAQVWRDLQAKVSEQLPQLDIFTLAIEMDEECILFKPQPDKAIVIHRQDMEDLWNTLRLHGTVSLKEVPQPIQANDAVDLVFELLSQLPYVRPIDLQPAKQRTPIKGLQYMPLPQTNAIQVVETVR